MKELLLILLLSLWITTANSQVTSPESIAWNETTNSYIISDAATGKLVSMDKSGYYRDFTTGLNQPKGLTIDLLSIWVTDLRDIVEIDAETGDILNKYTIIGAGSLNDIVADDFGYLYITDTQNGRVYRFDQFTGDYLVFSKALIPSANGIYYDSFGGLIVVTFETNARIFAVDVEEGNVDLLMQTQLGQLDGITYDKNRDRYYISSWGSNSVYIFDPSFELPPELLKSNLNGPADIYFDSLSDTLIVPVMNSGQIVFIGFEDRKVEILGSQDACENSISTFYTTPDAGYTNQWSVTDGQIQGSSILDSISVLWGATGTGKVKLVQTNTQNQGKDSAEITITINPLPIVNILGNINVCENEIEIYIAQNKAGVSNKWTVENGTIIGNDDSDSIEIQWNTIPENEDSLTITGFVTLEQTNNTTNCSAESSQTVNISKKPRPNITGKLNVCQGDLETYFGEYIPDNSYEWQISGGSMLGDDKDTVVRIYLQEPGEAHLTLIQTNALGCIDTARTTIIIHPLPSRPAIIQNGSTLISSPAFAYQWLFEGNPIQGANQQSYMPVDSGAYKVEITDENGCKSISNEYIYNPTSVDDDNIINTMNIYPNPVSDKLYFGNLPKSISEIKIYSILCVVMLNISFTNDILINGIDISFLSKGLYYVEITNGQSKLFTKIIKE